MILSSQLTSLLGERLAPVVKAAILIRRERGRATVDDIAERLNMRSAGVLVTSLCQRGYVRLAPGGVVIPLVDLYGRRTSEASPSIKGRP